MFNFSGSEIVFLLLLALIILGPEKLPEAVRKFGRTYAEFKKVSNGFQTELRQALDEPVREMRETAELFKQAATFDVLKDEQTTAAVQQQVVPDGPPDPGPGTAAPLAADATSPGATPDVAADSTTDTTSTAAPAAVVSGPLVQRMRSLDDVVAAPRRTASAEATDTPTGIVENQAAHHTAEPTDSTDEQDPGAGTTSA